MLTLRDQAQLEAVLDYLEGWWAALSGEFAGGVAIRPSSCWCGRASSRSRMTRAR